MANGRGQVAQSVVRTRPSNLADIFRTTWGESSPLSPMPRLPGQPELLPWEEEKFQKWIAKLKREGSIDTADQGRTYDYRAAYKQAGLKPDIGRTVSRSYGPASWTEAARWPEEFKMSEEDIIPEEMWEPGYLSGRRQVTPIEPGDFATVENPAGRSAYGAGDATLGDIMRATRSGSGVRGVGGEIRHTGEAMKALGLETDDDGGDLVTQGGQLVEAIANDPTAVTRGKLPNWMEPITTTGGGLKGGIEGVVPEDVREKWNTMGVLGDALTTRHLPSWDEMYPKAEEAVETVAPKSLEERWLDIAEQRFKPKSMKELIWPAAVQGGLSMLGGWMGSRATNAASRRQEERYQQAQKILEEDRARRMASENYTAQLRHAEEAGIGAQRKRLQAAAIPGLAHGLGYELDQSQFVPPALDPTFTGAQQPKTSADMAPPGYVLDASGNPVLASNQQKGGGILSKLLKYGLPAAAIAMPVLGAAGVPGFGWASKLAGSLFGLGGGGGAAPAVTGAAGGVYGPGATYAVGSGAASKLAMGLKAAKTATRAARVAKTLANAYQSPSPTEGELDAYPWMNQGSTASSTADTGQFQDQSLMDAYGPSYSSAAPPPGYEYDSSGALVPMRGRGWRRALLEG